MSNSFTKLRRHFDLKYRVTIPLVQNLLLTSKWKFRFGRASPGQARPKRNFCSEVNRRFKTSGMVTLYALGGQIWLERGVFLGQRRSIDTSWVDWGTILWPVWLTIIVEWYGSACWQCTQLCSRFIGWVFHLVAFNRCIIGLWHHPEWPQRSNLTLNLRSVSQRRGAVLGPVAQHLS